MKKIFFILCLTLLLCGCRETIKEQEIIFTPDQTMTEFTLDPELPKYYLALKLDYDARKGAQQVNVVIESPSGKTLAQSYYLEKLRSGGKKPRVRSRVKNFNVGLGEVDYEEGNFKIRIFKKEGDLELNKVTLKIQKP